MRRYILDAMELVIAAETARLSRVERRRQIKGKLTREDLVPPARSPWRKVWEARNDAAFLVTMAITVELFEELLGLFAPRFEAYSTHRADVNPRGKPRLGRRLVQAHDALALVLHWLGSACEMVQLQQIFAMTPTVCSRYLAYGRRVLLSILATYPAAAVIWPSEDLLREYCARIDKQHPLVRNAFGFVDGMRVPIMTSGDPEIENATYNGWTASHCVSNIFVFGPDGLILFAVLNAPGSWHDAQVARSLFEKLDTLPPWYTLLADSAFPSHNVHLQVPFKEGAALPADEEERQFQLSSNNAIIAARQAAEWGMRSLEGTFGRLKVPLSVDSVHRSVTLNLVMRLHQLRVRRIGISQIRSVYYPPIHVDEVGERLFKDIIRSDRLQKFYFQN